ncbi:MULTISPECIES: DUF4326 domain-containing protein [Mesorhizobium]|uniref:DUF4326 domain-containing protein n=1 Tax=Mesorhizobium sp. TaxID=1871066 RepID=UPI000A07D678|nr:MULTISPECIES: DUF4326 domain-containing protein [Mesorhizobium]
MPSVAAKYSSARRNAVPARPRSSWPRSGQSQRWPRRSGFCREVSPAHQRACPKNTLTVARPGPWGNPFVVGKHGDAAYCVDLYKALLAGLLRVGADPDVEALERTRRFVAENADELRGKNLACWCKPDEPCHADVLLQIANSRPGQR